MNAVELGSVTKVFGKVAAVSDLSLVVPRGSIYGFIGPNGAGKTTTLRMITGIFHPDRGLIQVLGNDVRGACSDRHRLPARGAWPLQADEGASNPALLWRTQRRAQHGGQGRFVARESLEPRVTARTEKSSALSKGMARKSSSSRTVLAEPELLILDEPFSGLDP